MFRPLYRSEIRYYSRFRRFVPVVLMGVLLEFGFQSLTTTLQSSISLLGRAGRILEMLLDPLVWFAAWIGWHAVIREYKTKRAEELQLSFLTSTEMFGAKYWPLVMFLLVIVTLSLSISWSLSEYFFYGSTGQLPPFPASLFLWLLFTGYYPALLGLSAPVVVWLIMIAFPRSARQWNGLVLGGLLLQLIVHGSFYCGFMALILLKARYNVWPDTFLSNPLLDLQLSIVAVAVPFLAVGGWWARRRFTRILDLPKD